MSAIDLPELSSTSASVDAPWPAEVELILSALEAAGARSDNRRRQPRFSYRVPAHLRLFSDPPNAEPWRLYGRDISVRGFGFVTRHRLPLGHGGKLEIPAPARDRILHITVTIYRCRELSGGWFDGSLCFNREPSGWQKMLEDTCP